MPKLKQIENLRVGKIESIHADGSVTVIYDKSAGIDNRASTNDETWRLARAAAKRAGIA